MNRRHFLVSSLALLPAMPVWAEMLKGRTPLTGQREQSVWLTALKLGGLRLAKPDDQIQIIFFIDPNCPACAKLWTWFDTSPRRNLASLWIPVAYMRETSEARAIALLRAPDPYAALAQNFRTFDHATWQGAIPPAGDATLVEQSSIRRNTRFWDQALFGATPLILYRAKEGGIWQYVGLPEAPEMEMLLTRIAPARLEVYPQQ